MPDNITMEQRRLCMSRNNAKKDTSIEMLVRSALHRRGLRFRKHVKELPGKPDIVFTKARIAVFIDGDYWHGYGFHKWRGRLSSEYWRTKIAKNRARDVRNHLALRSAGWRVIRVWEHSIRRDLDQVVQRIITSYASRIDKASGQARREPNAPS